MSRPQEHRPQSRTEPLLAQGRDGLLDDLFAGFPDPLAVVDRDWHVVYANDSASRMAQTGGSGIVGRVVWEAWPHFRGTDVERSARCVMERRTAARFPYDAGAAGFLDVDVRPCREGVAILCRNVSIPPQRDDAEDHPTGTTQARLAAIVESSDDAIISKDLQGIIRSWNRGAERIFGYTAEEAIGKPVSMLAVPERVDEIPNILERISRGERVEHFRTKRKTKDGRVLSISLTVSPIRNAAGTIVGASKIARDITEQERFEEALRIANESLSRSNADLQQFAYSASHDLQEPLRMVATYADMLRRKFGTRLDESGDEYIGFILEGALRMEQLLSDLRAFTHISTTGEEPTSDADANDALRKALSNLRAAIDASGASVTYDPLPRVRLYDFQLQQLFQNLIGNAIRYRSTRPPRIHVSAELCGSDWRFSVQDNGIGIDPRYKEQIFGIFKRLHSAADYPGTGMGLAICERIVQRAGGRIWVESQPGNGSTFLFTIPAGSR